MFGYMIVLMPNLRQYMTLLGLYGRYQSTHSHYRYHSFQIVSQHMQAHFCGDIVLTFHQEVRRTHPHFCGIKRVFNGLLPKH